MHERPAELTRVAGGCYAWVQPDGGWGLSNAGLVVADGESVLIDTLFDGPHTARMLEGVRSVTVDAPIRTAVNTHGNGDHWFGNELLPADVSIVAAEGTVADMRAVGPETVAGLLTMPGAPGDFARRVFGAFDFGSVRARYPTATYRHELELSVGGVDLLLIDVGPAHTAGDTVVYCERDGVVFTGDIVFAGGTPIMWQGPVQNWINACRRITELGAQHLVPGHGPVTTPSRVQDMSDYLEYLRDETARRHTMGMDAEEAARDIPLGPFAAWPEAERLAVNVHALYRELSPEPLPPLSGPAAFGCMGELQAYWDGRTAQAPS